MPPSLEELQQRFHHPGVVEVTANQQGLSRLRITSPSASAEIYLHGAQLTSWKPAGQREVLFLSEQTRWEDGRAIRGGIPICFPWFRAKADDPKAPAHGVARTRAWQLESVEVTEDAVTATLSLPSDEKTRQWFPHDFHLQHTIRVGAALELSLAVTNTGATPFSFEEALHTYHLVGDAKQVSIRGLDGLRYLDNMHANCENLQAGDLRLTTATDSAYVGAYGEVVVVDPIWGRSIRTAKQNSATTVVWNPWSEGAASLADLGDQEWQSMICAEASNILGAAVTLEPGQQHVMRAELTVSGTE